jgi:radial spoke head protein 3
MRAHQEHFEHIRNAELVATQKLEQAERRKVEEKERRLQEAKERVEREKVVREKIAASMFARGFLTGMMDSVIGSLWQKGHFRDPVEVAVKETFLPWLQTAANSALERRRDALAVISSLVSDATAALEAKQQKRSGKQQRCQQTQDAHKVRIWPCIEDVVLVFRCMLLRHWLCRRPWQPSMQRLPQPSRRLWKVGHPIC